MSLAGEKQEAQRLPKPCLSPAQVFDVEGEDPGGTACWRATPEGESFLTREIGQRSEPHTERGPRIACQKAEVPCLSCGIAKHQRLGSINKIL